MDRKNQTPATIDWSPRGVDWRVFWGYSGMTPPLPTVERKPNPRRVLAAEKGEVVLEQLAFLIDSVSEHSAQCSCQDCKRYQWHVADLLGVFE